MYKRQPYANAFVKNINTDIAMKVPGIEAIFTYKDVDQNMKRLTCAGQTYPEPSPYDRLILDKHVRFIGDPVAIVAGADERCVDTVSYTHLSRLPSTGGSKASCVGLNNFSWLLF